MPRSIKSAPPEEVVESPQHSSTKKSWRTSVVLLVMIALASGLAYSQYRIYKMNSPAFQKELAEKRTNELVGEVSKLMELPEETPQIATVEDANKLRETQPEFFRKAENGDAVLIYSQIAILYSGTKHKIMNVGPIIQDVQNINNQTPTALEAAPVPETQNNQAALEENTDNQ